MESLTETAGVVWNIVKVALGLGFVIFIHELGTSLLAKWNGVKVEKFSIGFGPTLASWRRGVGLRVGTGSRPPGPGDPPTWGETEYILAALPLGGYVKMLGENHEESTDVVEKSADPRAYNNKSVWARMQIITAGVIMNILLGIACFTFYFTQGYPDRPARVGGVLPGSPAYKAGLRAGDEIVALDGRRDVGYKEVLNRVTLSGAGREGPVHHPPPGVDARADPGDRALPRPTRTDDARHRDLLLQQPRTQRKAPVRDPPRRAGRSIQAGRRLQGEGQGRRRRPRGRPAPARGGPRGLPPEDRAPPQGPGRRRGPPEGAARRRGHDEGAAEDKKPPVPPQGHGRVPPHHFVDFGLRLASGPIVAIRPDSPASKAGLKAGDVIEQVDGKADFDPDARF